jgi:phospholipid/cholesterol/gamma-HCH transport system substrate-binding protein
MKGLSLEVRVGLLILAALALFGAFAAIMSDFSIGDGYTLKVDFNNPGNLQPGAAVNIGSIRVGRVDSITYRGGELDQQTGRRSLIRVNITLGQEYKTAVHRDARFYVTSTSIVGESLLAIDPGNPELPAIPEGSTVLGIDPPRMDLAFAMAYELLQNLHSLLTDNREEIESMLHAAANMIRQIDGLFTRHSDRIDHIVENVESITNEVNELTAGANRLVNGAQVQRIVRNVDHTLASVSRDIDPILADARSITNKVDDLLDMVGPQQQTEIQTAIHDGSELVTRANNITEDAGAIVTHIREGRGTVGAILMEEELYDDIQEMVRDLKHNPWKLFWRE